MACGYRITTHEVDADFFEEAKQNQILVAQMRKLLSAALPLPGVSTSEFKPLPGVSTSEFKPLNKCSDCQHNVDGLYCTFDFPEYETSESYDCIQFQLFKSK